MSGGTLAGVRHFGTIYKAPHHIVRRHFWSVLGYFGSIKTTKMAVNVCGAGFQFLFAGVFPCQARRSTIHTGRMFCCKRIDRVPR